MSNRPGWPLWLYAAAAGVVVAASVIGWAGSEIVDGERLAVCLFEFIGG